MGTRDVPNPWISLHNLNDGDGVPIRHGTVKREIKIAGDAGFADPLPPASNAETSLFLGEHAAAQHHGQLQPQAKGCLICTKACSPHTHRREGEHSVVLRGFIRRSKPAMIHARG